VEQSTAPGSPGPRRQPGTFRVGQIGGVDVLVRSSWLLVAALISVVVAPRVEQEAPGLGPWKYVAGLAFAVLLYLSVLLHEMSHALMAKRFGLPVRSITLHFLGGVTEIEGETDTPGREFGVSVVGPLTSLAVGAVALAAWQFLVPDGLLGFAVGGLAVLNLLVGVLNLVPGLPLDGGRVLRAAVWKITGNPHRGTIVAGWGGRVLALLVLLWPLFQSSVLGWPTDVVDYLLVFVIALFLWGGASTAIASARIRRKLPALNARTLARRALAVPHDLPLSEAVRRAQENQAGSLVVLDAQGHPSGIVSEQALVATPEERRPWLAISTVTRTVESGLLLPADMAGEELIRAMQRTPATEYLLVEGDGSIYGVLTTEDVDKAFAATL
jgi:Zn-dependent protease